MRRRLGRRGGGLNRGRRVRRTIGMQSREGTGGAVMAVLRRFAIPTIGERQVGADTVADFMRAGEIELRRCDRTPRAARRA